MGFQQLQRTIRRHLWRDDGGEIIFKGKGIDGSLRAIGVLADSESAFKDLVFVPIPVETNTDTHIFQQETLFPLLKLNMRSSQYANRNIHKDEGWRTFFELRMKDTR